MNYALKITQFIRKKERLLWMLFCGLTIFTPLLKMEYFGYQNSSLLAKDIYKANQANEWIVNQVKNVLICLGNAVNRKRIPDN